MAPQSDLEDVVNSEIKCFIDIYFHQNNAEEHAAALELRDCLFFGYAETGAFVAPHGTPPRSYEIWVPSTSFAPVFSYLCQNRGKLSILIHPLTKEEVRLDHQFRNAWMGAPFPLDLSVLPDMAPEVPLQYPSLSPDFTLEERRRIGANVERILEGEKEAARAPPRESN
ncbi:DOPA-like domain-containing protein [Pisolithus tinctorius]|nr:DOPA-like domain-containing protein [Pisolithus tinctorius]